MPLPGCLSDFWTGWLSLFSERNEGLSGIVVGRTVVGRKRSQGRSVGIIDHLGSFYLRGFVVLVALLSPFVE